MDMKKRVASLEAVYRPKWQFSRGERDGGCDRCPDWPPFLVLIDGESLEDREQPCTHCGFRPERVEVAIGGPGDE